MRSYLCFQLQCFAFLYKSLECSLQLLQVGFIHRLQNISQRSKLRPLPLPLPLWLLVSVQLSSLYKSQLGWTHFRLFTGCRSHTRSWESHRALRTQHPTYLAELTHDSASISSLCSSDRRLRQQPRTSTVTAPRAFAAPRICNSLPASITASVNYCTSKNELKTHLFAT